MLAQLFSSPSRLVADLPDAVRLIARLRWLMLGAGGVLLLLCAATGLSLPWLLLLQALATLALFNHLLARQLQRGASPLLLLRLGLLADVLALTECLAFSGGAANPLASLYLPPVLFAALLSPGVFAWGLSLLSMLAYAALFGWHLPWPLQGSDAAYAFSLHLVGMWLTFALSALLITSFVSWLARQLAAREAALAAARKRSCGMNSCWRWACRQPVRHIRCPRRLTRLPCWWMTCCSSMPPMRLCRTICN